MKARDIFGQPGGQAGELTHKARTITDLIRHIKTKENSSPANYSIFLGAGASVSSGVRSGGQLTDEWANELYERFKSEKSSDPNQAKDYFKQNHPNWYNSENPYSSLFEKKFDLPTQRRRFVEQEVDSKLPSIGYAYLVSLVDNNYFNTIFTTNFDDLVNEAFYLFSNKRPIVCAHDSSIRSMSIASKRPKIVKLHGDYLFDDIKSTLRETESLEQNTKEKFVEFCKEYGLIVAGYSGCDRSIMDVLEFLVKQDNYLNNGIYWCLRPEDEVCHNLRNLIWKDKVYPVLIDGFDELFAEIHLQTVGKELNLNSSTKKSKLEITIKKILEDPFNLSENKIIQKEISSIQADGNSKDISGFIKQLSQLNDPSGLDIKELRNLLEITSHLESKEFDSALATCERHYLNTKTNSEKQIYIEKYIEIYTRVDDSKKAMYWCEKLCELDPNNVAYLLKKASFIKNIDERIRALEDLSARYEHNITTLNSCAKTKIKKNASNRNKEKDHFISAQKQLTRSLEIDPSLNNPAWDILMDILTLRFDNTKCPEEKDAIRKEASEHVKSARMQHPEHHRTISLLVDNLQFELNNNNISGLVDFFQGLIEKSASDKKDIIRIAICKAFSYIYRADNNSELKEKIRNFFTTYEPDSRQPTDISLAKARYLIAIDKNESAAREEISKILERKKIGHHTRSILNLPIHLRDSELDLILEKLEEDKHELTKEYYHETLSEIYNLKLDYEMAMKHLEFAYSENIDFESYIIRKSYLLLKLNNYKEVISLVTQYPSAECEAFKINTEAARKKLDLEFNQTALRNLAAQSTSEDVKICAFSLLDQHQDAKRLIRKQIDKDPGLITTYLDWPALSKDSIPKELVEEKDAA